MEPSEDWPNPFEEDNFVLDEDELFVQEIEKMRRRSSDTESKTSKLV